MGTALALTLGLLMAAASAAGAPADTEAEAARLSGPIDLSHPINARSQNWPGGRGFSFTKEVAEAGPDGNFLAYKEFCMAEHLGTHLDAPFHFNETAWKVGEIPLQNLLTPGVLIDASAVAATDRNLGLGKEALESWELQHGRVPEGSVVLLRFGWASKYGDRAEYFGLSTDDRNSSDTTSLSFPGASAELARALADRKIVGVGLDTPSIDPGNKGDHEPLAHRTFCNANIYILENVNLKTTLLPPKGFTLIVMPANIEKGTGAPVRIVAVPGNLQFGTAPA